jgi:DNA-binding GntR family transcriptional regulator
MLDGHAVQALEDHEAIFAAIVDKDGDRAADATEAHLRRIESGLFQAYEIG